MVLTYEKNIENNVFYMTVKCKELGTSQLKKEEEEAMLINFPTTIEYKDLTFERKFNVSSTGDVVEDAVDGETVTIKLNNRAINVDKNFKVDFQISTKMIKDEELGTILDTKEKVAEAKAQLFKLTIKDAVQEALEKVRAKSNNYEVEEDEEVI